MIFDGLNTVFGHIPKFAKWAAIAISVLVAGFYLYMVTLPNLVIFPQNAQYSYFFYTDAANGGNSTIIGQALTDSSLRVNFKLGNQFSSPYIGLTLHPKNEQPVCIYKYNQISLAAKGQNVERLVVSFFTPNPYKNHPSREIIFQTVQNIDAINKLYRINFSEFKLPDWWSELNNLVADKKVIKSQSTLLYMNLSTGFNTRIDNDKAIELYYVALSRNNSHLTGWVLIIVAGIWVALILFGYIRFIVQKTNIITVNYNPLVVTQKPKPDFLEFINQQFHNCDLTLELVADKTNTPKRKITNTIQEQFGCNFKTYVNRIRITESKRLLKETDLNIGEIAFKVGFNNQSHFNRVFKAELNISPTDYRHT
jgi:AraC-like DNA-binding protein